MSKPYQSKFKRLYGKTFYQLKKESFFSKNPHLWPYSYNKPGNSLEYSIQQLNDRLMVGI